MANDLNQFTATGRLGRDPETRTFSSGDQVTNFSLAIGKAWKDKSSNEFKESVTWLTVSAFGYLAEKAGKLQKGDAVLVGGEITVRKWQDQSGQDRYSTEIRADRIQPLGSKDGGGQSASQEQRQASAPAPRQAPTQRQAQQYDDGFDSTDIPF